MFAAVSVHAASMTVDPSNITVGCGSVFVIDYVIHGISDTDTLNLEMAYDASKAECLGIEAGSWWEQATGYEIDYAEYGGGIVSFTYTILVTGGLKATGTGTVAKVTFQCRDVGVDTMSYVMDLWYAAGPVYQGTGTIEVVQTPEPITLCLIGGSLIALGTLARKRS